MCAEGCEEMKDNTILFLVVGMGGYKCESECSKTLGLGLKIHDFGCQDQVLVLVLTEF